MTDPIDQLKMMASAPPTFEETAVKMLDIYCDYNNLADGDLQEALTELLTIFGSLLMTLDARYGVESEDRLSMAFFLDRNVKNLLSTYVHNFDALKAICEQKIR